MFSGDELEEIRDRLTLQANSFMQIIRDLPSENLVEAAKVLKDTEVELLRLKREQ